MQRRALAVGNIRSAGFSLRALLIAIVAICLLAWYCTRPRRLPCGCQTHNYAPAGLKQLASTESTWRHIDADGNGIQDYWTLDVAGFYGMQDASGSILKFIDVNFAKSDDAPRVSYSGRPRSPLAKSGYRFRAMLWDENGAPYNVNYVPTQKCPSVLRGQAACNPYKFGFCAVPDTYGTSGTMTYIVNESGVIYGVDTRGNQPVLRWPGTDPTRCTVKGRFWSVLQ